MRNFQKLVAVIALSGLCFAAPSDSGAKKKVAPKKKDVCADQIKDLKQAIEQQQAATAQLQEQLRQTQQQLQQTQQQLTQAQSTANAANAKAAAVETSTNAQVQKVQADLSDVKGAISATDAAEKKTAKEVADLEHPNSLAYKGIRITPGGFLELTEYWRSHATLSDQATAFGSIPLEGQVSGGYNTRLTEFGLTARDSRIVLRADADAGKTKLTGYFEVDFFGAAPTANNNQTTSFNPRMRQAWGRAKFANGWTITGGQMWNLLTLNKKGLDADNATLWIPNIMEAQYSVGYDWGRWAELRVAKQLDKKTAFAVSLVNPAYLNFGATAAVSGLATAGNGLFATGNANFSTNILPDVMGKLTYDDPKLGHYEVKAIGRMFRDRVVSTTTVAGHNVTASGYGFGGGAVIPLLPKKIDFIAQGLWGKGISRYQDSGAVDFVVRSDNGGLLPLEGMSFLAGFETHPTPKTELDLVFGDEYYKRDLYVNTSTLALTGYGAYTAVNSGCYYETAPAGVSSTCTGNNKNLWNGKIYGYYDVYKGSMGTLRYGAEFDYVERATWSGLNGLAPKGNLKTAYTTMRYIFP